MRPEHARRQRAQSTIEKVQAYSSREVYGKMALSPSKLFERLLLGPLFLMQVVSASSTTLGDECLGTSPGFTEYQIAAWQGRGLG